MDKIPPKDNLVRAMPGRYELRESEGDGGMPTMAGHFAVFNEWTEINSMWEGHFLERFAPGAFKKTFSENRNSIKALFQHGFDPQIGDKVLGPIDELEEDEVGGRYAIPLLDTSYNRDLLPGLQADLYGSSMRFKVHREKFDKNPQRSAYNPEGLPERTVKEAQVLEFGPVTFPAYAGATAGIRSMTDEFLFDRLISDPAKLKQLVENKKNAPVEPSADESHPEPARRKDNQPKGVKKVSDKDDSLESIEAKIDRFSTVEELEARREEIRQELTSLDNEFKGRSLSPDAGLKFDELGEEAKAITERIRHLEERKARMESLFSEQRTERQYEPPNVIKQPKNVWDLSTYRQRAGSPEHEGDLLKEGAMRALEISHFPSVKEDEARTAVEKLLRNDNEIGEISRRILSTGSPSYMRAFGKQLQGRVLTDSEQRDLTLGTGSEGGFAVPYTLDPSIIPTSNSSVNPIRALARVETISGSNEWRGVSSGAIVASRAAELAEATDNAPTLAQPTVTVTKVHAFVPFSIEIDQDWGALQGEMAALLADAKDDEEATAFITGSGAGVNPEGVVTGTTTTVAAAAGLSITAANVMALEESLPPRFRPRGVLVANRGIMNRIRQLDTTNSWFNDYPTSTIAGGFPNQVPTPGGTGKTLLGYPLYEASAMQATIVNATKILLFGDFRYYILVDRVGMNVEVVPHLFGAAARFPTGQRGLYAYWRNSGKVLSAAAFRALTGTT